MDALQLQAVIEQILNSIFSQGPDAIQHLVKVLQMIAQGATSLGAIATLIAKFPILIEVVNQLLALIISGAGIPEIVSALVELVATLGISSEALIHLLQMISGFLVLF
jgi:hypothetical protein